jgi:ceramide glucosyltransferase
MMWVWCALTIILWVEGLFTLIHVIRFRRFFLREISSGAKTDIKQWPKVALLAPCKGIDPDLRENVLSWLALDYPDFKLFFIVDSDRDPVRPILQEFRSGEIVVAGQATDSGQKVHNLRHAIQQLPAEYEVFAFVDSDCRVKTDWLSNLVSKLLEQPDNAVTGYRWFTNSVNFGSLLRAAWNSSILTLYKENAKGNFAWGGATAIFRQTFQSSRVIDFWKESISDDYSLTKAMQSSQRRVIFVPGGLAFTHDSIRFTKFLRWAFRQLLITRIYYPKLWGAAFLFHSAWFLWLVTGLFFPIYFWPSFLLLQVIQSLKANIRCSCVARIHEIPTQQRISFWLLGPVVGLCNFTLLLSTVFTRRVSWRGVEYFLAGQNSLIIRHR